MCSVFNVTAITYSKSYFKESQALSFSLKEYILGLMKGTDITLVFGISRGTLSLDLKIYIYIPVPLDLSDLGDKLDPRMRHVIPA